MIRSGRRIKHLWFDKITYISPAAALVLASEVDCWNQRGGQRLRASIKTWDVNVKRLLIEMGYFELLDLVRPKMNYPPNNITFLPFIRGDVGTSDPGKMAQKLRRKIEEVVSQGIRKHVLFFGLSEAITNVGHHAYPPTLPVTAKKQWWLSASYRRQESELVVLCYDQGAGIPETLPNWRYVEHIKGWLNLWTDAQKIMAAMEYGRTSTLLAGRGKGLQNLIEFASVHAFGRLSIYSLRGLYRISMERGKSPVVTSHNHKTSIGGTLIEWRVQL